jgi:hypothetical protein
VGVIGSWTTPRRRRATRRGAIGLAVAIVLGCGRDETPIDARASAEPEPIAGDCTLVDASGASDPLALPQLHDPVAQLLLTNGCPGDLAAVAKKLERVDGTGCDGDLFAADRTTMISEIAQLRGEPSGDLEGCTATPAAFYRGVMQRGCGGRAAWELSLSVGPLATVLHELPTDLEAIAWDPTRRELAFYTLEEGTWRFFGHSSDMLRGPGENGERRCAACHPAGGLVMKELAPPWLYWEGRLTTPGVDAILSAHEVLGSRTAGKVIDFRPAGKELEDAITAGNAAWVRTKVEHLRSAGTTRELLRPLFCTVELNLGAASDTATPTTATGGEEGSLEIPGAFVFDPRLVVPARLPLPLPDYHAAIAEAGQRMEWSCGARLTGEKAQPVVDTPFDLAFPHRATIDTQHVDELVRTGVIDDDLATAVLGVDATRPIFSAKRCGLLEHVPELPPADREAAEIRAAVEEMLAKLGPADPAASELAANLESPRGVKARVAAFMDACARRPSAELARDVVRWASWLREKARQQPVLEFRESLPVDDLDVPDGTHFDLASCTLVRDP